MKIDFKFKPFDLVTITVFGIRYPGRISYCIYNGLNNRYEVAYAEEGQLKANSFMEDELELT